MKLNAKEELMYGGDPLFTFRHEGGEPVREPLTLGAAAIQILLDSEAKGVPGSEKLARANLATKIQDALGTESGEVELSSGQTSLICSLIGAHGSVRLVGAVAKILGDEEFE